VSIGELALSDQSDRGALPLGMELEALKEMAAARLTEKVRDTAGRDAGWWMSRWEMRKEGTRAA